jgi:hypothetical protein
MNRSRTTYTVGELHERERYDENHMHVINLMCMQVHGIILMQLYASIVRGYLNHGLGYSR